MSRQVDFAEGKETYESRKRIPRKQDYAESAIEDSDEQSDEQNRDEAALILPFSYVVMWVAIFGNSALELIRSGDRKNTNSRLLP